MKWIEMKIALRKKWNMWEISLKVKCFAKVTLPKNNASEVLPLWLIIKVACPRDPRIPVTSSIRIPRKKLSTFTFNWNPGNRTTQHSNLKIFLPCKKITTGIWKIDAFLEHEFSGFQLAGWCFFKGFKRFILRGCIYSVCYTINHTIHHLLKLAKA